MKIKIITTLILLQFAFNFSMYGGEGMWLPYLLKSLNESEMKSMGMKISVDDIYNINKGSIKDAVAQFSNNCTSVLISPKGLLLTNNHCSYSFVQRISTIEKNHLKNGYWAKNAHQEIPCNGLSITLIVRMEDVTSLILNGVDPKLGEWERRPLIEKNTSLAVNQIKRGNHEGVVIKGFYNGNQYIAFVTSTYKDVRLVGTPPESIGRFGADTDNWVWPNHSGDFSIFRVYADANNLPAEYSTENIPYTPKHFLPISLDGFSEGDFTMVLGFPGTTNEYLTAEGVRQIAEVQNPIRIQIRDFVLKTIEKYMREDPKIKLQYAPTHASIANSWKKWIGQSQGIKVTRALEKKRKQDETYQKIVDSNPNFSAYRNLIPDLEKNYKAAEIYTMGMEYYAEAFQRNIKLNAIYNGIKQLLDIYEGRGPEFFETRKKEYAAIAKNTFDGVNMEIDKKIFAGTLEIFMKEINIALVFPYLRNKIQEYSNDYQKFSNDLYNKSVFTSYDSYKNLMELDYPQFVEKVKADPVWKFFYEMNFFISEDLNKTVSPYEENINNLRREHMASLLIVYPEKRFYPDANLTMRLCYGKVEGFNPKDGIRYLPQTFLDGLIDKYIPGDYEFDVDPKLIDLYNKKDYGQYGQDGKLPVAFIASNHTTGGCSGAPTIDAYGNLLGLNFDRPWEGTMSDINYDVQLCRNTVVDIRYILFVVDKFANSPELINEMKIVHPKKNNKKKKKG